ncbi:MAG: methionine--tRNA ligase [Neisseriaceae bacterium]
MKRKLLVTSALPYANGDIHLGHLVEHIQTDIWVRFQKIRGHECYYVCADDTHGTPIMLAAEQRGISPETLIAQSQKEHQKDFAAFLIHYDNYYSTHSEENKCFSIQIFEALKNNDLIIKKKIQQLYDPEKKMFLPDRFIKGDCPKCGANDQYGDNCEVCGASYSATELINPYSAVSGATPVLKETEHFFFRLSVCEAFLKNWIKEKILLVDGSEKTRLQLQARNKLDEWLKGGLQDWDITRDAPYFGFEIPGAPSQYFYVWLDAPIGYMTSFFNLCQRNGLDFQEFFKENSSTELYHFIGKDILYFHALFWPAILKHASYRTPTAIYTHGFLTINGQKMSKSRGTFITARAYLESGLQPAWLRYYIAAKLTSKMEDIDLKWEDFITRVNSDLVGKYINIAARITGFVKRKFHQQVLPVTVDSASLIAKLQKESVTIAKLYEEREFASVVKVVMHLADTVNAHIDQNKPWELAKLPEKSTLLHYLCSEWLHAFRILTIYLSPILPDIAAKVSLFFNVPSFTWEDSISVPGEMRINNYEHLSHRVEEEYIEKLLAYKKQNSLLVAKEEIKKTMDTTESWIDFNTFSQMDLRVGRVLACEKVEGSNKLLKFQIDFGDAQKTIFSGIAATYTDPSKLIGRLVVALLNLPPRKMATFGISEGMLLSAINGKELTLLEVDESVKPGAKVG